MKKKYSVFLYAIILCLLFTNIVGSNNFIFAREKEIQSISELPFQIQKETGEDAVKGDDYKVESDVIIFHNSGNYKIIGNGTELVDRYSFKVAGTFKGEITIKDINLTLNGVVSPFEVESEAQLTLWIEGRNQLKSSNYNAAIEFMNANDGFLKIDSKENGYLKLYSYYGAAIGGAHKQVAKDKRDVANIEIRGGNIEASYPNSDSVSLGVIGATSVLDTYIPELRNFVISGGNITLENRGSKATAIGTGAKGIINGLRITGGTINILREGNGPNPAIGAGKDGIIKDMEISGGNINVVSSGEAPTIGAGGEGTIEKLKITGGNIVAKHIGGDEPAIGVGVQKSDRRPVRINRLEITGGTIETSSGSFYSLGAPDEKQIDTMIIDGGSIRTHNNVMPEKIISSTQEPLAQLQLNDMSQVKQVVVDGKNMNISGNHIDDTSLYLYLSKEPHTVEITKQDGSTITKNYTWTGYFFQETQTPTAPAENEWIKDLSIENWVYGEKAKQPSAAARHGEVTYSYSRTSDGQFSALPRDPQAGTWYVKAEVAATSQYKGLTAIKEFQIQKANSTLRITNNLNKAYDGEPVAMPEVETNREQNELNVSWYKQSGDNWTTVSSKPVNVGNYKVEVSVASSTNYNENKVEQTFAISQASNAWQTEPSIQGWKYNEAANKPIASATYGDVIFTYSDKESGPYGELPSNPHAGTWYVKAEVQATAEYTGLSKVIKFEIIKATAQDVVTPTNLQGIEGTELSTIMLPSGWEWVEPGQIITAGQTTYSAKYKVDDQNYDYQGVAGYNQNGYVIRNIIIEISNAQHQNEWEVQPSIEGWTYKQQPNRPTATPKYGTVEFTYSDQENGTYGELPTNPHAGTWYMKAKVIGTTEYTGLEMIVSFEIKKAMPSFEVFSLQAKYGQKLSELQLPAGFYWQEDKVVGTVGEQRHFVKYVPKDTTNYETVTNIEITVHVNKAQNHLHNEIIVKPSEYGDPFQYPTVDVDFGTVIYLFSDSPDGNFTTSLPTGVGQWYIKVVVEETENYAGIETQSYPFEIKKKNMENVENSISFDEKGNLIVNNGNHTLIEGIDYVVYTKKEGNETVYEIVFQGNYQGTIVKRVSMNQGSSTLPGSNGSNDSGAIVNTGDYQLTYVFVFFLVLSGLTCLYLFKKRNQNMND